MRLLESSSGSRTPRHELVALVAFCAVLFGALNAAATPTGSIGWRFNGGSPAPFVQGDAPLSSSTLLGSATVGLNTTDIFLDNWPTTGNQTVQTTWSILDLVLERA